MKLYLCCILLFVFALCSSNPSLSISTGKSWKLSSATSTRHVISHGEERSSDTTISDSLEIGKLGSDAFSFYNYLCFLSNDMIIFFSSMIQDSLKGTYAIDNSKHTLKISNPVDISSFLEMGFSSSSPNDISIDYPDIKYSYYYKTLGTAPYSMTFKTLASRDSLVALLRSLQLPDNLDSIVYTLNIYNYTQ